MLFFGCEMKEKLFIIDVVNEYIDLWSFYEYGYCVR